MTDEQKLAKAIALLQANYNRAKNQSFIKKPMANALYETWKYFDGRENMWKYIDPDEKPMYNGSRG